MPLPKPRAIPIPASSAQNTTVKYCITLRLIHSRAEPSSDVFHCHMWQRSDSELQHSMISKATTSQPFQEDTTCLFPYSCAILAQNAAFGCGGTSTEGSAPLDTG